VTCRAQSALVRGPPEASFKQDPGKLAAKLRRLEEEHRALQSRQRVMELQSLDGVVLACKSPDGGCVSGAATSCCWLLHVYPVAAQ
jgi:hypothetical protein